MGRLALGGLGLAGFGAWVCRVRLALIETATSSKPTLAHGNEG